MIAACAALLVSAAGAAAETWTGESTTAEAPFEELEGIATPPEAALVKSSVTYESTSRSLSVAITTRAAALSELTVELGAVQTKMWIMVTKVPTCTVTGVSSVLGEVLGAEEKVNPELKEITLDFRYWAWTTNTTNRASPPKLSSMPPESLRK